MGDLVDGLSVIKTVASVCTSLSLGAMQIITRAQCIGWVGGDLTEDELTNKNIIVSGSSPPLPQFWL
jgi:choline-glycine betaine transporter